MVDDRLSDEELSSVKKLAFSVDRFEPFVVAVIPQQMLRHLVETGVAEKGRSCRPAVGLVGYRLTEAGWRIAHAHWNGPGRPISNGVALAPAE